MDEKNVKNLLDGAPLTPIEREEVAQAATSGGDGGLPAHLIKDGEDDSQNMRTLIGEMTIGQKMKLALLGNGTARGLLIRDPNRMIQELVLENPRLTVAEVEDFARNANTSDNILRIISNDREFMRSYGMKIALVFNPKSPNDIALKWIRFLRTADLRLIARSKNIPQIVAIAARKRIDDAQK